MTNTDQVEDDLQIDFRKFQPDDIKKYQEFCISNFGKTAHQSGRNYVDWLYGDHDRSFDVAVSRHEIVGIEHNFKAPILINDKVEIATVLHDLMVSDRFKGRVGFRLMQESLKADKYLVLPGSVGRLSRAYGRLGSKKIASHWYRKFQLPRSVPRPVHKNRLLRFEKLAQESGLLFGHNKDGSGADKFSFGLGRYAACMKFHDFLDWRFLHDKAPLTFSVRDFAFENAVLFVLGRKGKIPYARMFYVMRSDASVYLSIVQFIERFAASVGIPVVLHSSLECDPPKNIGYRIYKSQPVSYVYSNDNKAHFDARVPTFCTDIGFDGLNIIKED